MINNADWRLTFPLKFPVAATIYRLWNIDEGNLDLKSISRFP